MKVILFTGGARSGKSAAAERYAGLRDAPVIYVATAAAGDEEMRARIAQHRARRPAGWGTLEVTGQTGAALRALAPGTVVLLDCLTLLVSNILLAHQEEPDQAVEREIEDLLAAARERALTLIVVTSEVGMGVVPEHPQGRRYRDLLGRAAQRVAAAAQEVYLVVAGIAVELRCLQAAWAQQEDDPRLRHDDQVTR
jgi:adenosylcobinamide kinase/adenosylcobinamide-phosphate guanylyltransferase